jgi:uncharacterized protein YndB with AHSA1/START domain
MATGNGDSVRQEIVVPAGLEEAFRTFTEELRWWPSEFTWSRDKLVDIAIECEAGGACYETGPYGFPCDWGRVLKCDPPDRLVLSWQIGADRRGTWAAIPA